MEVEISQKVAAIPGTGRQAVPVTSKALAVLSQEMHLDFKGPKQKNLGKVLTLLPELCSVSGGFSSPSRSYMEKPLCLVETPGVSSRNTFLCHPTGHAATRPGKSAPYGLHLQMLLPGVTAALFQMIYANSSAPSTMRSISKTNTILGT